jgi:hypothetical protein
MRTRSAGAYMLALLIVGGAIGCSTNRDTEAEGEPSGAAAPPTGSAPTQADPASAGRGPGEAQGASVADTLIRIETEQQPILIDTARHK